MKLKWIVARFIALEMCLLGLLASPADGQSILVSTGSVWKYLDTGDDAGAEWRALLFDDSGWSNGVAQLGFGENDEATTLQATNAVGEPIITYYFRQPFTLGGILAYTNLVIRLRRDDGAVVYINEVEVFRSNLSLGPLTGSTLAATAPDDGADIFDIAVSPTVLLNGANIISVEVHQASSTSSDVSFDLELLANVPLSFIPFVPRGSVWSYLDDGSDPGTAWTMPSFDDTGWSNGLAELGFGDGDESARIRQFSDLTGANGIAFYFRHAFVVADPGVVSNLVARVVRDDGAVIYLNGSEVFRINMPPDTVTSATFAAQVVGNDNTRHSFQISPGLLHPGDNVIAVEVHQFNLTSSDLSFDLELRPNVLPILPVVALTAPAPNSTFYGPTNVTAHVLATDLDNPIAAVELYVSGGLQGTDTTAAYDVDGRNYSLTVTNLAAGTHTLVAVATDIGGLASTSAPVTISIIPAPAVTTLISTGAVWKYLDTGVDQGTAWRAPSFNDRNWPEGQAKFGTNDPGNVTILHITPINVNLTAYFRHYFLSSNSVSFTNLAFRVLRDDGCVVYLNGSEIFRMNIPAGPITFNYAVASAMAVGGANETTYYPTNIIAPLIDGTNVLAVELHQTVNTSDAGFDLGLIGMAPPSPGTPPLTIQLVGGKIVVTWAANGFILQEANSVGGVYNNLPSATSPHTNALPTGNRFYRLVKQ
jgi:hypothetical protein